MFLFYVVALRPFAAFLASEINLNSEFQSEFLWVDSRGIFCADKCRAAFCSTLKNVCDVDLNFNAYRQAVQAIAEHHIHISSDQGINSINEQFGHSTRTGFTFYGRDQNDMVGVSRDSVANYLNVSLAWHNLLGFNAGSQVSEKKKNKLGNTDQVTLSQNINVYQTNLILPGKNLSYDIESSSEVISNSTSNYTALYSKVLTCVKKLGFASFKSVHQAELAVSIVANQDDILGVLPTGGGKTLTIVLPLMNELGGENKTSVLVAPLVGLRDQIVRFVRSFGFSCDVWNSEYSTPPALSPRLVVVAVENAVCQEFVAYLKDLDNFGRLCRVIIDECHLINSSCTFRSAFRKMAVVRVGSFPLVLLSATVPPSLERELSITFSSVFKVVRMSTVNWKQQFAIRKVDSDNLFVTAAQVIKAKLQHGRCAVLFVKSMSEGRALTASLNELKYKAAFYSSELSPVDRQNLCSLLGSQFNVLVATSAFSVGIDVRTIDIIIHYNCAWSLLDYMQECGRAGREGQISHCVLLSKNNLTSSSGDEAMNEYIKNTSVCRRAIISRFMDNATVYCPQQANCQFCDICLSDTGAQPPAKKQRFTAYPVSETKELSSDGLSIRPVKKNPSGGEILRAVSEDGKVEALGKAKPPSIQTAAYLSVQKRFAQQYKDLEGLIKLLRFVKEQGCAVCLLNSKGGQLHTLGQCPYMKNTCISCYGKKHSDQCSRERLIKLCFRCAMPGNLGPLFRHGDHYGIKCQQGLDDLLVPVAMQIWRNEERRASVFKDLVTGVQFDNVHNYSGYWKWLCQRSDLDLPNFVYVLKYAVDKNWM